MNGKSSTRLYLETISRDISTLDVFFRQIKLFIRFRLAFVFGLKTHYLIDFSKIDRLKGLE